MQVLFLHLSDIHLKVNHEYSSEKIRRIVDAVPCELPFDCAFLIISGDLAFSGSAGEYHVAKRLIDDLICGFRSKGIKPAILFVPGNHDISIPQDSPTAEMLIESKRTSLDDAYAHELEKMDPFSSSQTSTASFAVNTRIPLSNSTSGIKPAASKRRCSIVLRFQPESVQTKRYITFPKERYAQLRKVAIRISIL